MADLPIAHEDHPLGNAGDVGVVGDHQDGLALVVGLAQQAQHVEGGLAIQVAGRFISQQNGRLVDEGARQRHALFLAARKLGRDVAGFVGHAQLGQQALRGADVPGALDGPPPGRAVRRCRRRSGCRSG